jgi:hypothetical protein
MEVAEVILLYADFARKSSQVLTEFPKSTLQHSQLTKCPQRIFSSLCASTDDSLSPTIENMWLGQIESMFTSEEELRIELVAICVIWHVVVDRMI